MIRSFIFSDGKLVGQDLEREALRLASALTRASSSGWICTTRPMKRPSSSSKASSVSPARHRGLRRTQFTAQGRGLRRVSFIVTHAVDFTRTDKFATTELDLFLGKDYLVSFHTAPLKSVPAPPSTAP